MPNSNPSGKSLEATRVKVTRDGREAWEIRPPEGHGTAWAGSGKVRR